MARPQKTWITASGIARMDSVLPDSKARAKRQAPALDRATAAGLPLKGNACKLTAQFSHVQSIPPPHQSTPPELPPAHGLSGDRALQAGAADPAPPERRLWRNGWSSEPPAKSPFQLLPAGS